MIIQIIAGWASYYHLSLSFFLLLLLLILIVHWDFLFFLLKILPLFNSGHCVYFTVPHNSVKLELLPSHLS